MVAWTIPHGDCDNSTETGSPAPSTRDGKTDLKAQSGVELSTGRRITPISHRIANAYLPLGWAFACREADGACGIWDAGYVSGWWTQ